MKLIKHNEGIYEIENFLTDEELGLLNSFITSTTEGDWLGSVDTVKGHSDYWTGKFIAYNIPDTITKRLHSIFDSLDFINPIRGIQRLKEGESMPAHVDTVEPNIKYGAVIYLNDDFAGGFTVYPNLDFGIKPRKGNLVIHDAAEMLGASTVYGPNTRYILSAFIRGSDDQPALLSADLLASCCQ